MKPATLFLLSLLSSASLADCVKPPILELPAIPSGAQASADDMLAAQKAVQEFVESGEAFLACGEPEPFVHNLFVHQMERAAHTYNRQLGLFKQQASIAAN